MAGFGWYTRQGSNVHEHHARKSLFPPAQIACRICNKAFLSTQSLINHIYTHMVNYETAATRRQNHELLNYQIANPNFHNNLTSQTPLPHQPPNLFPVPDSRSLLNYRQVPPTNLSLLTRKNLVFGPQLPRDLSGQQPVQIHQRSGGDFTKPFIDQLQKKVPAVERHDGNNMVYGSEMLDLTLKL